MEERLRSWRDALTDYPGSTRSIALMRMAFACLAWTEFGHDTQSHRGHAPPWLALLFFASTFLMFIGFRTRIATAAAGFAMMVVTVRVPNAMHHHTYLLAIATLLLALTPCGGSLSLDRWLALRRAERANEPAPAEHGNLWALRLIGLQMSAVFFWGGYNKLTFGTRHLQTAFLSGERLEQTLVYYYELPVHPPGWLSALFAIMGTSVVLFELFAGIGVWIPRVRLWVLLGCMLMTATFQVFLSVGTFGPLSWTLYLAFVPADQVHRFIDKLLGVSSAGR